MDSDSEDEEDDEQSVKNRLLSLMARVLGQKLATVEVEEYRSQSLSECIYSMLQNHFFLYFGYSAFENDCTPSLLQAH